MEKLQGTTAIRAGAKYLSLCCLLLIPGCQSSQQPAATAASQAADEAAVRQTDEDWNKAAQSKQVDAWVSFYSDDAVILPPNDVKSADKEHIRKVIGDLLALPDVTLSFAAQKVVVAQSGDLAYTQGAYDLTYNDAHGKAAAEHGKTVEIWKKQSDGKWKCTADMWSSDAPAPTS
jgi:ketosteroid isomerase-like protein